MYLWLRLNAGTGKSTLVRFIIDAIGISDDDVAYVTFTGKASLVLREKGCPNAMTAHKLLYKCEKTKDGDFTFIPRTLGSLSYKLIVVDEISMLSKPMWDLLLKHDIHVIALGDPFQIPPILKDEDNHVLDEPHIFLDEIMRQAQESEIIQVTMNIRNRKPLNYMLGKEVQIVPSRDLSSGMLKWADQIIVATNQKRNEVNDFMRKIDNHSLYPEHGDKVICCQNKWEKFDSTGTFNLVNGTIGYIKYPKMFSHYYYFNGKRKTLNILRADIVTPDNFIFEDVIMDYDRFLTGKPSLTPQEEYYLSRSSKHKPWVPIGFEYGYAITGHRAQGSTWGKVLVLEERFPFDKIEHARWLYTSCSRPSDKLVLVR